MNFYIHNIRVNSIASIGSLNIGNTILSGNRSTILNQSGDGAKSEDEAGTTAQTTGSSYTPLGNPAEDAVAFDGDPPPRKASDKGGMEA